MTYTERLRARIEKTGSHLCVGLDPRPHLIQGDVYDFLRRVVDAVSDAAAAFKPNIAYFEAMGVYGYKMLNDLLHYIPEAVPVILDAKRGDIPETQAYYAKAYFEHWNVAAVTVNPYLGFDACEPFLSYGDKGVYVLAITSNAGAEELQLKKTEDGFVFDHVLRMAEQSKSYPATLGFVLGLTQLTDERMARIPDAPLLIPGLGAQNGDARRLSALRRPESVVVNVSRGVLYDSGHNGFHGRAIDWRDKINHAIHG